MLATALVIGCIFIILLLAEYGSRFKGIHSELTRKFVHMSVGTFVAFWPFFLSWRQIQLLSLAFFVVISLSVYFNIFRSIHAVNRNWFGEVLFAIVIGFLAVITAEPWVFTVAMLHLSLGDGLAAVVGTLWGGKSQYKVMGHTRSVAGTAAFVVMSYLTMAVYIIFGPGEPSMITLIWVPLLATITENVSIKGMDNLFMPIVVALTLMSA